VQVRGAGELKITLHRHGAGRGHAQAPRTPGSW
jgi:hypothetical protein